MARTISDSQILDAALDVLAQRGYDGATTREIAAAAGINAVTLFRRFSTKKALLLAAVEREAAGFSASGIAYSGDVAADLEHVVRFYVDLVQRRGHLILMLLNEIPRHPDLLEVLQIPMALVGKIAALIERYQHEGVLVAEHPMQAVAALAGPIFIQGLLGSVRPDMFEAPLDARCHVQGFLAGRATAGAEG